MAFCAACQLTRSGCWSRDDSCVCYRRFKAKENKGSCFFSPSSTLSLLDREALEVWRWVKRDNGVENKTLKTCICLI